MHNYNVGNRFTTKTKIGNWYEEQEHHDHQFKEYLYQKQNSNNLMLNTTQQLAFNNQQVLITSFRYSYHLNIMDLSAKGLWNLENQYNLKMHIHSQFWHLIWAKLFWERRPMLLLLLNRNSQCSETYFQLSWLKNNKLITFDSEIRSDWLHLWITAK